MKWCLLFIIVLATAISLLLCRFFIKGTFSFLKKRNATNAIRFSSQSKPIYGGIAFYSIFLFFTLIFYFVPLGIEGEAKNLLALLAIISISFFMGLADDLLGTPPSFKFIIQIVCAFILIRSGIFINLSPIMWINYTITFLWVVGIMNSINMLDNMDAITGSVSLSIIIPCVLMQIFNDTITIETFAELAIIGAILGFMHYNWAPAKMYMGDNGSQFLGILLAYVGIKYFWNGNEIIGEINYAYNAKQFVMVALAFIVPLSDTTTVTINRLLRGQSPFVGGKDHTTHYLFYRGYSVRKTGLILLTINVIGVILAMVLIYLPDIPYWVVYLFALYPITMFSLLYINTKITQQK